MALPPPSLDYVIAQSIRHPEQRAEAFASLLRTQVTIAGKPAGDDSVSLGYLTFEGEPVYPFFTSQHIYWGSVAVRPDFGPENLVMPASTLFEMTLGQRLVLNPDGPFNIVFEPDDVEQLLATGTLPMDRGVAQMADDALLDQLDLEHELTQTNSLPESVAAMRRRLEASQLLLLGTAPGGGEVVEAGSQVEARVLTDEQGPVCPLFTSHHMVRASMAGVKGLPGNTLTMSGADVMRLVDMDRFVVNPHGPAPLFFSR